MNKAARKRAIILVHQEPLPWKKIVNMAYGFIEKETGDIPGLDGKTAADYIPIKRRTRTQVHRQVLEEMSSLPPIFCKRIKASCQSGRSRL